MRGNHSLEAKERFPRLLKESCIGSGRSKQLFRIPYSFPGESLQSQSKQTATNRRAD